MQFQEIINQQSIQQRLLKSVQEDRVSHAQLLLGPEGCGKLALALAYAQYVNCENPSGSDSCGECPSCRKSQKLVHPDIHYSYPVIKKKSGKSVVSTDWVEEWREFIGESPYRDNYEWLQFMEAGNKQGNIPVDECRDIINKLNLKTFEGKYKVVIMWHPEYLGKAGNTLLKVIEEPPENTLFLLVAENQDLLLNTILSRVQIIKVPPLEDHDIQERLVSRYELEEENARQVSHLAEGNFTKARKILHEHNAENFQLLREWLNICALQQKVERVTWVEKMARLGREEQKNFLRYVLHLLRQTVLYKFEQTDWVRAGEEELKRVEKLAGRFALEDLEELVEAVNRSIYQVERNANPRMLFFHLSTLFSQHLRKESQSSTSAQKVSS